MALPRPIGTREERRTSQKPVGKIEEIFLRAALVLLLLVLVGQGLLRFDITRPVLSYVYRLEGIDYGLPASEVQEVLGATFMRPSGWDVLTVTVALFSSPSEPGARLLIDGFVIADFTNPQVTVEVTPKNRLQLDTRGINRGLLFRIVDASPQLASPKEGDELLVKNALETWTVVETR